MLDDIESAKEKLQQLRSARLSKSLDDFGAGYSSLSYLQDLPLDRLKIDKSFVDKLLGGGSEELIRSIVSIGQHMHLKTVAEGTETREQVDKLNDMGCDYFQGYYFSKPVTWDDFIVYCQDQQNRHRLKRCYRCLSPNQSVMRYYFQPYLRPFVFRIRIKV